MNKWGSTGITSVILLISFILIAVTAASFMIGGAGTEEMSEEDIEEILDDILDEITTYIQIKDKIGKYYTNNGEQRIEKIAILVKPLISNDINISELTIKMCDGNSVKILNYCGNAEFIGANSLFEHPLWNIITDNNFGFIVTFDRDRSLVDYNTLNEDMAYVIIKLSDDFSMAKGESMAITLFPLSGITRTTTLEAPLPIKSVVTFE